MEVKRGRGRPKGSKGLKTKPPTFIRSFRVTQELSDFCQSLDNTNEFIKNLIVNSKEYQAFIAKTAEQENEKQPSLF